MSQRKRDNELIHSLAEKRASVKALIRTGLGYCCLWAFFSRNKSTTMIATRLGVTPRAIRYQRQAFRQGEFKCEGCDGCLKEYLK